MEVVLLDIKFFFKCVFRHRFIWIIFRENARAFTVCLYFSVTKVSYNGIESFIIAINRNDVWKFGKRFWDSILKIGFKGEGVKKQFFQSVVKNIHFHKIYQETNLNLNDFWQFDVFHVALGYSLTDIKIFEYCSFRRKIITINTNTAMWRFLPKFICGRREFCLWNRRYLKWQRILKVRIKLSLHFPFKTTYLIVCQTFCV